MNYLNKYLLNLNFYLLNNKIIIKKNNKLKIKAKSKDSNIFKNKCDATIIPI